MTTRRSVARPMLPAGVTSEARRRYSPGFGCGGSLMVSVTGVPGTRSSCFEASTLPLPELRRTNTKTVAGSVVSTVKRTLPVR